MPATCPYPESDESSPCSHSTSERSVLILSSHLHLRLKVICFPQVSPPKSYIHLSFPSYIPRNPLPNLTKILSLNFVHFLAFFPLLISYFFLSVIYLVLLFSYILTPYIQILLPHVNLFFLPQNFFCSFHHSQLHGPKLKSRSYLQFIEEKFSAQFIILPRTLKHQISPEP